LPTIKKVMSYNQTNLSRKPNVISAKKRTAELPVFSSPNQESKPIQLQDYVNLFLVNEVNEVLVLEGSENGRSWSSWQLIGRNIDKDEDPLLAVQENLLECTGYTCKKLIYLGTYIIDESRKDGAGHFFCAQVDEKVTAPIEETQNYTPKWVAKPILKQAMLDGRIAVINHVVSASLAMVMCERIE
jgi:8-oxo-dGTP pyrophosphatase MutT (NUDIX family)